ncbi:hypothetical protein HPB47_016944 [Ixodes persulcatus]|uniref:Uncharacterized protein n=1 Tax=Ixodes persulcatus TaxID=34615 RepID=A0AC60QPL8_IXOPE|nr:hypothetical protein HPB47_016944 [Ixodes persulcatus]
MILADSQPVVHTYSPCQAFKLVFFAHFAFKIVYCKETSLCLEFMQRTTGIRMHRGSGGVAQLLVRSVYLREAYWRWRVGAV